MSTPAAAGGLLSNLLKRDVSSPSVPEQNRAEGVGSEKVPFRNFADAFAALLQEASGKPQIAVKQTAGEPPKAAREGQQNETSVKGMANVSPLPPDANTSPLPPDANTSPLPPDANTSPLPLGGDVSPLTTGPNSTAEKVLAPAGRVVQAAPSASPDKSEAEGTETAEQVHLFEQPLWQKQLGVAAESPLATPLAPQKASSDIPALALSAASTKKKPTGSTTVEGEQNSIGGTQNASQEAGFSVPGQATQVLSAPLGGLDMQPNVRKQQSSSELHDVTVSSMARSSPAASAVPAQTGIGTGASAVDPSGPELQVTSKLEKDSETKAFSLSLSANGVDQVTTEKTPGNDAAKPARLPTPQLSLAADSNQPSATPSNPRKGGEGDLGVGSPSLQALGISRGAKDGNPEGFQKKENGKGSDFLSDGSVPTPSGTQQVGPSTAANFKEVAAAAQSSHSSQPTDIQGSLASGSTKELVVRLQGQSGETISVRLTDHGGQLQVAVRSSDPAMASTLRQDLPSLTSNLDRIGWKTDIHGFEALASAAPAHDPAPSGGDSNSDSNPETPDWEQQSRRQKNPTPDLWDEALDRQSL